MRSSAHALMVLAALCSTATLNASNIQVNGECLRPMAFRWF
jgi:hypothetical protein